jgi:biotin carboxyl carrier protein
MSEKIQFESINVNGVEYKTLLTRKFKERKTWSVPNPNMVHALIPGNINKLYVKEGQKVKEGTKLLLLEAMKMKNIILSPVTGTIKKINVTEGVKIPKNTLMVEIE